MGSKAAFFYRKTINVFTDTSDKELTTARRKFMSTCPGFVATYQARIISAGLEAFIDDATIFGESKAIDMAVNWCIYAASRNIVVPEGYSIFSDNHAAVMGVCNKLIQWFNEMNQKQRLELIQNGQRTAGITWEDNIFNAAYSIFCSGLPIRIFYTPGHVAVYNRPFAHTKQNEKFIELNKKVHGDLSDEVDVNVLHEMATYNNIVDMMTRNYLFVNKKNMEYDIDRAGEIVGLGQGRFQPVRWPFIIPQLPNYMHRVAPPQLMLCQS